MISNKVVIENVGGEETSIFLRQQSPISNTYYVIIDDEVEAMLMHDMNGWRIHPKEGSRLSEDNCEAILITIGN